MMIRSTLACFAVFFCFNHFSSAYLPPKSSETSRSESAAAVIRGGYGNIPEANAVNYGLSSIAPAVQVTYGSINALPSKKRPAAVSYGSIKEPEIPYQQPVKPSKPVQSPHLTSYGASPVENVNDPKVELPEDNTYNTIVEDHRPKPEEPKPALSSYSGYSGAMSESQQVSVGAQQKPKQLPGTSYSSYGAGESAGVQYGAGRQDYKPPTTKATVPPVPYGGSYGAAAESAGVQYRVKPQEYKPPTTKATEPPATYGGSYGGEALSKSENVQEKPKVAQPPPAMSYGSYSAVGGAKDEQQYKQSVPSYKSTLPPTPAAPVAGGYGSAYAASKTKSVAKEVKATGATQKPTQKPPVVPQSNYGVVPSNGYGVAPPQPKKTPSAAGTSSNQQQQLPTSYGSYMQWKKDQIVDDKANEDEKVAKPPQVQDQLSQEDQNQQVDLTDQDQEGTAAEEETAPPTEVNTVNNETPEPAVGPQVIDLSNDMIKSNATSPPAPRPKCDNGNEYCDYWREKGECEKNPRYMSVNCPLACGTCPK